ncbi:SNARE-associated family protein [Salix suchowensis]|nr:SNARE-associated family protein [Salix suchowensis]
MDPSVSTGENTGSNENNSQESESESESNNNRSDALGKALSTMLVNVIKDFDSKAQDTLNSQDKLNSAIDRLTRVVGRCTLAVYLQHAAKISGVRKRVSSLNSVLKSIQHRVDNIDRLLSVGMLQGKTTMDSSSQH